MCHNQRQTLNLKQQRGGALAIAVFVIVVMSLLTIAISRNISASTGQTVHEVLGTRALLAAEAGNEIALSQIFPIATGSAVAKQSCPANSVINFNNFNGAVIDGLRNCIVTTSCRSEPATVVQNEEAYYFVESTGVCKDVMLADDPSNLNVACQSTDGICVSRRVEVEAKAGL